MIIVIIIIIIIVIISVIIIVIIMMMIIIMHRHICILAHVLERYPKPEPRLGFGGAGSSNPFGFRV